MIDIDEPSFKGVHDNGARAEVSGVWLGGVIMASRLAATGRGAIVVTWMVNAGIGKRFPASSPGAQRNRGGPYDRPCSLIRVVRPGS
jgi:hypothetical protein